MKIRNGFVSNSSSTSFCIYGVCLESSEIQKLLSDNGYEMQVVLASIAKDKNIKLEIISSPYENDIFIGRNWSSIKDNETGGEFKKNIEADIKSILGNTINKFNTYEEAWRDG